METRKVHFLMLKERIVTCVDDFKGLFSVLVSGLAARSAELGGCDREGPGPTVPFP